MFDTPADRPNALADLVNRSWYRASAKDWADVLAALPLFSQVPKRHLRKIAGLAEHKEYSPGDFVVQVGEPGDAFYLILSGRAKIVGNARARSLRTGDYFGELALLDGQPRSATVAAATELEVMSLGRRAFLRLLEQEPKVAIAILAELGARLRRQQRRAVEP